jgi:hypothetical protein
MTNFPRFNAFNRNLVRQPPTQVAEPKTRVDDDILAPNSRMRTHLEAEKRDRLLASDHEYSDENEDFAG